MLQKFYAVYAIVLFVIMLLLVLPFAIVVAAFNKRQRGMAVMRMAHVWSDVWLFLVGIRHQRIVEQELRQDQSYIFVSNHNSYMDIPQLLKAVRTPVKGLGKAEAGKIPLFGLIYNAGVITVKRSCPEDRARSLAELRDTLHHNISIYIAPEGTFNQTSAPLSKFYDGAFRLSIETQTPIKPLLFLDAVDRMHWRHFFSMTPGRLRTVYLEEISPEGYGPEDVELLKQKVFRLMEERILYYQPSWIEAAG